MTKLTKAFLAALSVYAISSAAQASVTTCFSNKVIEEVKVYGNYTLKFKVDKSWYTSYYNVNYVSGRAIYQMVMTSMLTGVPVTGEYESSSCGGYVANVTMSYT